MKKAWCGQMVENNRHQGGRRGYVSQLLKHTCEMRIVDRAMYWEDTPQGHDYWSRIQSELGSI